MVDALSRSASRQSSLSLMSRDGSKIQRIWPCFIEPDTEIHAAIVDGSD
jgi:hypothetical protein